VSDADGDSVTLTLSGDDAVRFSIDQGTGALTFTTAPNFESPSDADSDNSYRVTVTVSDGTDQASQAVVVSVTDVNEAPVIATINSQVPATSGFTSVSVAEPETTAFSATASDPDSDSIIYRITGVDASLFSISSEGVVTFNSPPDFEIPLDSDGDNIYAVTVVAADAQYSDSVPVQVTVTDAQEGISGTLIDGYLAGSTVFQDINNNGVADSGEPSTTTDVLGNFSLTLTSTSPDARIRVVNSGFDIGANETLGAMLDINPNTSGSFIMTPASTVAARMLSYQALLNATETEAIIADSLGLTLADLPDDALFGYDPLVKLGSSDSGEASEARGVVAANQFLMASANVVGAASAYTAERVLTEIQEELQNLVSDSGTVSLSISDYNPIKAVGHSAYMDAVAEELSLGKPSIDAIRLDYSGVQIVDYIDGAVANTHYLYPSTSGGTLDLSVPAPLDLSNLYDLVGSAANGTAPAIRFTLNSIPEAGSSGRATVTTRIYDGTNATRDAGERVISTEAVIDWASDGSTVTLTAPVQDATVTLIDESGIGISRVFRNEDTDIMSFTESGPDTPATLELKLTSYISRNLEKVGLNPAGYFDADTYYLDVDISGLEMRDASNQTFTKVAGQFVLAENPDIYVYPLAGVIGEGNSAAKANFALSRSSTSDITATYTLASGTAAQGTDFDGDTGTLTFTAGESRATVAVQPVKDNLYDEGSETLVTSVSSANGATAVSQTATVTLIDSKQLADNATARNSVGDTTVANVNNALADWFVTYLGATTPGISGITGSFADYLTNDQGVSDLNAWVSNYITDKTPGFAPLVTSFIDSLDTSIDSAVSTDGTGSDLAIAVTKVMTGTKYIDYSTILNGSYINDDGSLAVTEALLASGVASAITAASSLVADTIGDPLGNDTRTNFADAQILILTAGDDDESGTSGSDLIASLGGTDTVNGLGGNDKLLGGSGVDTLIGGSGNDHLYGFASNDTLTGGDDNDKLVGGLGDDTISGGSGDDEVQAQTGDDIITTGGGNDTVYAGLGNDTVIVDEFSGNKTVSCFSGSDTLKVTSGLALSALDISGSSSFSYSVSDQSANTLNVTGCEFLEFNELSYRFIYNGYDVVSQQQLNTGVSNDISNGENNRISHAFISSDGTTVVLYAPTDGTVTNYTIPSARSYGTPSQFNGETITITGSSVADMISDRGELGSFNSPELVIYAGDGDDQVRVSSNIYKVDRVYLEAGDDQVFVGRDYRSPAGFDNETGEADHFDGGAGSDWIAFSFGYWGDPVTYTLNTQNSSNFENIGGSTYDDTLTGDASGNIILGGKGNDDIYGAAGDDTLYGGIGESCGSNNNLSNDKGWGVGLYYNHYYQGAGIDRLFGEAGNDTLYGQCLDDYLDGGLGADVLHGGDGSDTFVIRSGDGGNTIEEADVIQDFAVGTDVIGLDGISFNDLTIEQGSGSYSTDTIIKLGDEILTRLSDVTASDVTILSFSSTATTPITVTGTDGDDQAIGGSGDDVFSGGGGSDTFYGWGGDDEFTVLGKTGSFSDNLNGGSGSDTLIVSYGGYTLVDFSIAYNSAQDSITFTDPAGGTITATGFELFRFNNIAYRFIYNGYDVVSQQQLNTGVSNDISNGENNRISHAFISSDGTTVVLYAPTDGTVTNYTIPSARSYGTPSQFNGETITITGSSVADMISDRGELGSFNSPELVIYAGDGDDQVRVSSNIYKVDRVYLEAGDDQVFVGRDYRSPAGFDNETGEADHFDGGAGSDWIAFSFGYWGDPVTYTLNTQNSSNFENIGGSTYDDTLTGDASGNIILGGKGNDDIYGAAGDDTLYGGIGESCGSNNNLSNDKGWGVGLYYNHYYQGAGIDRLFGEAGNDTLYGQCLDDYLDGGLGADVLHGGDGSDTFVIRSGDGGNTIEEADVIQDFAVGTDVIGLDGISFNDLTIEQGSGSYSTDTIIKLGDEILTRLSDVTASDVTILSFSSTATTPITVTGTDGDDQAIGGSGDDVFSGGGGSDTFYGWGGDDEFTVLGKTGSFSDNLNGGSGSDTLIVSYGGYTLVDFSIAYNSAQDSITFTDPAGGTITATGFELFRFNNIAYRFIYNGYDVVSQQQLNTGVSNDISNGENNRISHAFISSDGTTVVLYAPTDGTVTNYTIPSARSYGTPSQFNGETITITGSSVADMISDRGELGSFNSPELVIYAGDGDDQVRVSSNIYKVDRVYLEAGDDQVFVGRDYRSPAGFDNETGEADHFDGGAGSDWIAFSFGYWGDPVTYTLNTQNSSNFENIGGSTYDDTLTGDASGNIILGGKGNDDIYGAAGDDTLYGGIGESCGSNNNLSNDKGWGVGLYYNHYYQGAGIDRLFGEAGNDTLYGQCLDDYLDGGLGADVLHGGDGSDTFVIRSGDGGNTIEEADVIQDFAVGTDVIGLDGISFNDLTIEQGSGSYSTDTIIKLGVAVIARLKNVDANVISDVDFTPI
jgi:Ca2+-binding RTX toxin-like protein